MTPADCPAVESTGDGRAQDAAMVPPTAAEPARATTGMSPVSRSAVGRSTPAFPPLEDPRAGVDPQDRETGPVPAGRSLPGSSDMEAADPGTPPPDTLVAHLDRAAAQDRGRAINLAGGTPSGSSALSAGQAAIAAAMSEGELLSNITDGTRKRPGLCKLYGLLWYHTHNSKFSPSGFPDLVIVGRRTMYRELKRQKENPTRAQREWIAALEAAGEDVGVWRPADWLSGRIARELAGIRGTR